jgi:hypothetical protein
MTQVEIAVLLSAVFTLSLIYVLWPKSTSAPAQVETSVPVHEPEVIGYYVQLYCCGLQLLRCADDEDGTRNHEERFYVCSECGREVWVVVRKQVTEGKHASKNYAGARG